MILAGDTQARNVADRNLGHVLDLYWCAVHLTEDDVLDVVNSPALRQIGVAAGIHQADAADVDRLLPDGDLAAPDIDVGIAQSGNDLRYRDVVSVEFVQIDIDVILLGRAAP